MKTSKLSFVYLIIYLGISILGLRWSMYLGFNKDIGILSPLIFILTVHWTLIVYHAGKKK